MNYVLNGAMRFDQNQEGGIYYSDPNSETYTLDQWRFCGGTSGVGRFTVQRVPVDHKGFDYCMQLASTTQQSVIGSTDNMHLEYPIEGSRMKSWGFGSADADDITISFECVVTQAGEYPFALMNGINTRSYVTSFYMPYASTWKRVAITIPGDSAGVWSGAECVFGAKLLWSLGVGATASTSNVEMWQPAAYWNKTGSTQLMQYIANTSMYITGVQVDLGSVALPYRHRSVTEELLDLQRYYYKTFPQGIAVGGGKGVTGALTYFSKLAGLKTDGAALFQPVNMAAPNAPVTFYSPLNDSGLWYNGASNGNSGSPILLNQGNNKLFVANPQIVADAVGSQMSIHAVVNSRLGGG